MSSDKKNIKKILAVSAGAVGTAFVCTRLLAQKKKGDSIYEKDARQKNPMEGKRVIFVMDENDAENADGIRGHLEAVGDACYVPGIYDRYIKRGLDIILSFGGLVLLAPVYAGIAAAIKIDDPGPVFFTQKRLGQNKQYFKLHKFRSMKMATPHDVPTHMLENPDQYITRVGRFLRAHSLDELPQIWDIFIGNMSVIGPRPGLWNQDVLTAERDKYGANDVKPGLTGWAQINGRDEIEIPEKARLDGEYVRKESFLFDLRCFFGTISKVARDDSVVEGGTGNMAKTGRHYTDGKTDQELTGTIGFGGPVELDHSKSRKVLVTGAGSYIGDSFAEYAKEHYGSSLEIHIADTLDGHWRDMDFSEYDIIYHVAGIAHADVGHVSEEIKEKYYAVNTDLAVEVCRKAKAEGVQTFIFMSSMIIYGDSAPYGKEKMIDAHTVPSPSNFYGDSKLQADVAVREMADDCFKVIVIRPPMIYGKGSRGNYPLLARMAGKLPVFPIVDNQRSMLHIDNLCEFLCQVMLVKEQKTPAIVLIPQNQEWANTSQMVKEIAKVRGHRIWVTRALKPAVWLGSKIPGKIHGLVNKAFGNNCYAHALSRCPGIAYQEVDLHESISRTEGNNRESSTKEDHSCGKHILVISQYFYPETFRINDMCQEWVKRGYKVTVVTGIPNYPVGKFFEGYGYTKKRRETWNGIDIIRIPLIPRGNNGIGMAANYLSFVVFGFFMNIFSKIRADFVFTFEVSPMTQALIGCWYAKKHQIPHHLYVQDLWPENVITVTGISSPGIITPINKMVDYIYKNSDHIFATSPSFVEAICNRKVPVSHEKVHYWPQYAEDFYKPVEKYKMTDAFTIIFTGNIGYAQGLDILPKAAELLKGENVCFLMVGDGRYRSELEKKIVERNVLEMFRFTGRVQPEEVPSYLAQADMAFVSFKDDPLFEKTIPAKLQSYMACGMPVLAVANGETKRIIEEAECGICTPLGDPEKLAEKIRLLSQVDIAWMSEKALQYSDQCFSKKTLMDFIEQFFV